MRRRLLFLAVLTVATAIAVMLRSAAPDTTAAAASRQPDAAAAATLVIDAVGDCTISPQRSPEWAARGASQPTPPPLLDAAAQALFASWLSGESTTSRSLDLNPFKPLHLLSRITIRPPPHALAA